MDGAAFFGPGDGDDGGTCRSGLSSVKRGSGIVCGGNWKGNLTSVHVVLIESISSIIPALIHQEFA